MKVLIVNSYDTYGGAARAVYRLHCALLNAGIQSNMIVQKKFSNDTTVVECGDEWDGKSALYDKMPLIQKYPNKTQTLFSISTIPNNKLIAYINESDADIVHLHWVTNGFLKIEDLIKINKPIVWSLHDNWAFTGGCHIMWDCNKYKKHCGACPRLGSIEENDLSRKIWDRKKIFSVMNNLIIVGLSHWIYKCSKESSLLCNNKHVHLPNLIDIYKFKGFNKNLARKYWNVAQDKKLILFGAMSSTSDVNKGYKQLVEALKISFEKLSEQEKLTYEFIIFGNKNKADKEIFNIDIKRVNYIKNDKKLIKLYSAADVMLVPSLQENLSNTIMESLSCSTPVVAFDVGGNSDLIEHKINGYLAKPFDCNDLSKGIKWVLNESNYDELCTNARKKVIEIFSEDIVVKQYVKLYEKEIKKYNNQDLLIYRPDSNIKFITKDIDKWLKKLNRKNLRYVVYGKGTYGEVAFEYLKDKVVAFVDQKSESISTVITKGGIYHPSNLKNMTYDKIIISVIGREKNIRTYLINDLKINKNKIIEMKF